MNQKELKQMLSQVDEQYIAELLDAEETTSEAVPILKKSRRWTGLAATAAAVCIFAVGGGCLWWNQSKPDTGLNTMQSTADQSQRDGYALIWEDQELTGETGDWDAGGTTQQFSMCPLPFKSEFGFVYGEHYYNAETQLTNVFTKFSNGTGRVEMHMSTQWFLTKYCEPDVSKDANYDLPVIHIYEFDGGYELYYLHNDVRMSMQAYDCTAEEAETFASKLLLSYVTPDYFLENSSDTYLLEVETQAAEAIRCYTWEAGGETHSFRTDCFVYQNTPADVTVYCDENGNAVNAFVTYASEFGGTIALTLSSQGNLFTEYCEPDTSGDDKNSVPVIHLYQHDDQHHEIYALYHGLALTMQTNNCLPKDAVDFAVLLLTSEITPEYFLENKTNTDTHVLVWEDQTPTTSQNPNRKAGGEQQLFGTGTLPFAVDTVSGYVYYDQDGVPINAWVRATVDNRNVFFTISDAGDFFLECCDADLSQDTNHELPVIHINEALELTGYHSYELYYLHNGIALSMRTYNCTPEEAEAYAAALLTSGTTAAYIAENTSDRIEIDREDYMMVWDKGNISQVDPAEIPDVEQPYDHQTLTSVKTPFDSDIFTEFSGTAYLDENGTIYEVKLNYSNETQKLDITLNDKNSIFSSVFGTLVYSDLVEEYGKPVILGLEVFDEKNHHLRYRCESTSVLIKAMGFTAEESEALAAALLRSGISAGTILKETCIRTETN